MLLGVCGRDEWIGYWILLGRRFILSRIGDLSHHLLMKLSLNIWMECLSDVFYLLFHVVL